MQKTHIVKIRETLDELSGGFGENSWIEIYTDGSGVIHYGDEAHNLNSKDHYEYSFDGLGELADILAEKL